MTSDLTHLPSDDDDCPSPSIVQSHIAALREIEEKLVQIAAEMRTNTDRTAHLQAAEQLLGILLDNALALRARQADLQMLARQIAAQYDGVPEPVVRLLRPDTAMLDVMISVFEQRTDLPPSARRTLDLLRARRVELDH